MKRLFLRFFSKHENQIPVDSWAITNSSVDEAEIAAVIRENAPEIAYYIKQHPTSKVELCWL